MEVFVGRRSTGARGEKDHPGGRVTAPREAKEVAPVDERSYGVAAFFDLDGTLVPRPSLEKRLFSTLRYQHLVGLRNYFRWALEALRLAPRGIKQILHANKMYLQGVRAAVRGETVIPVCLFLAGESKKHAEIGRPARLPVPLYCQAIERVAWHAERRHVIVIVSGTLEFLAEKTARTLEHELRARGLPHKIRVCATRLEEKDGRWTGRILGEAMFGEAKARAITRIAAEVDLDLLRSFAYGDSSCDRWMLEAVGKPVAVNPSNDLARVARRNDWVVLRWGEEKNLTPRTSNARSTEKSEKLGQELQARRVKSRYGA
jgi:fatty acyl-CoA reductase